MYWNKTTKLSLFYFYTGEILFFLISWTYTGCNLRLSIAKENILFQLYMSDEKEFQVA